MSFTDAHIIGADVPQSEYRKQAAKRGDPAYVMSRGALMDFMACPSKWLKGYESPDTKATEWGTLIDTMALTPHLAASRIAVSPESYTETGMKCPQCESVTDSKKCAKCKMDRVPVEVKKPWRYGAKQTDEWRAARLSEGKMTISHETGLEAKSAIGILVKDEIIREFLKCSERQVMAGADYKDEDTGLIVPVKVLIDLVPDSKHALFGKVLGDLKTSVSANPWVWDKKIFDDHLDAQAALYLDVYTAATNEDRVDFRHVIQESEPPYQTARRWINSGFIEIGRMKYREALKRYARSLAIGVWPDYDFQPRAGRTNLNGFGESAPEPWMMMRVAEQGIYPDPDWMKDAPKEEPADLPH